MPKVNIHITKWRSMPNKKRLFPCNLVAGNSVPQRASSSSIRLAVSGLSRPTNPYPVSAATLFSGWAKAQAQFQRVSWCKKPFDERIGFPWDGQSRQVSS